MAKPVNRRKHRFGAAISVIEAVLDPAFAGSGLRPRLPFYAPAARLRGFLLNGYGHALSYAANAPDYHRVVVQWADGMVGK
jgi:hypothetical protein